MLVLTVMEVEARERVRQKETKWERKNNQANKDRLGQNQEDETQQL